jgi:hypothetical protein
MAGTKEDCWTQSSTITAECLKSNKTSFKNFLKTEGGEQIRSYVIQQMIPIIKTQPYPEPREKYILQLTINAGYDFIMATPWFGTYLGQKNRKSLDIESRVCNLAHLLYNEGMGFEKKPVTWVDKTLNIVKSKRNK